MVLLPQRVQKIPLQIHGLRPRLIDLRACHMRVVDNMAKWRELARSGSRHPVSLLRVEISMLQNLVLGRRQTVSYAL